MVKESKYQKFYTHVGQVRGTKMSQIGYETLLVAEGDCWVASDGQRFSKVDGMPVKVSHPVLALDLTSVIAKA